MVSESLIEFSPLYLEHFLAFNGLLITNRENGIPQILSNNWGIYEEPWDPAYARDPLYLFTLKVVEAMNEGIIVLFAAGNRGQKCAKRLLCRSDRRPGRSILGANGHPRVMTVSVVNVRESTRDITVKDRQRYIQISRIFSPTHFKGYFESESRTSGACPVADTIAMLKQLDNSLDQDQLKSLLSETAKNIGPPGRDQHSSWGIIQSKIAYDKLFI